MNNLVEERKPAVKGRTQGELPRDVSNLVNKTFQGIRAVYAVGHQCVVLHVIGLNYVFELWNGCCSGGVLVAVPCLSLALSTLFFSWAAGLEYSQWKRAGSR